MSVTETQTIVVDRLLPHPPEKVWRALTQSDLIAEWLMRNDFEPRIGHRFSLRAAPVPGRWNGVFECEVVELELGARLAWRQTLSGEEKPNGIDTLVAWTLTPEAGGTRLRLEHSGFRPGVDDGIFESMKGGWAHLVGGLERVLASLA
jgi:uncharacterized protein YndB with AHSA1/START domain